MDDLTADWARGQIESLCESIVDYCDAIYAMVPIMTDEQLESLSLRHLNTINDAVQMVWLAKSVEGGNE